ncbi:aspartyl protease family protein 2 [Malania oleifera]|uniref:aspartyl protease family protein 2 n=1 Tax=Malania oleifera TaxID=397392 RepID=UPI0025AE71F6|nr:aspartyl protease family protein 2 [Malania oleifera]
MSSLFSFPPSTMVALSSLLPLLLLFFTSADLCSTQPVRGNATGAGAGQTTAEYLRLPLLHKIRHTTPSEALSLDAHRLSVLFSVLHPHRAFKSPIVSGASAGSGQYFVELKLGTPPQSLLLVADTGSDLIWVKCSACRNCSAHQPGSAFLARHSTTFSPSHCYDSECRLVPHPKRGRCSHTRLHSPCRFEYSYVDRSRTAGFFSKETTTLNTSSGKEAHLNKLAFGCAFQISGPSVTGSSFNGAHGVMGLGRGPISFASQLGHRFGNKFSYCLMDYTLSPPPTSYLLIGGSQRPITVGSRTTFTPLLINPVSPTFYYIGVVGVFVDGLKLRINPSVWGFDDLGNGGTIVDSGTTLTFLPAPAYRRILAAFKRRVKLPSPGAPTQGFNLCVNVSGIVKPSLPRLSFELAGKSMFSPPARNYFIDTEQGVKCLAIQPVSSPSGMSVIGNLMQQGFLFEFDTDRLRLGFSRRGCGRP